MAGLASVQGDVRAGPLAAAPAKQADAGEESGADERERPLDAGLRVLPRVAVLLVLLLERLVGVVRVELGLGDVPVGEVRLTQDLRARGDEVRVAAHPVERVLEREDRAREVL